jgi:GNAT superfamily N-acetyltransferase
VVEPDGAPGIRVREARDADHLGLVELWFGLAGAGHAADPRYRVRPGIRRIVEALVAERWLGQARSHRVWVATDPQGRLVGYVATRRSDPHPVVDQDLALVVADLFVVEDARRRGVGRALVDQARAHARVEGVTSIEVGTLALDERAVSFWRSMGFGDWRVTLRRDDPADQ